MISDNIKNIKFNRENKYTEFIFGKFLEKPNYDTLLWNSTNYPILLLQDAWLLLFIEENGAKEHFVKNNITKKSYMVLLMVTKCG